MTLRSLFHPDIQGSRVAVGQGYGDGGWNKFLKERRGEPLAGLCVCHHTDPISAGWK